MTMNSAGQFRRAVIPALMLTATLGAAATMATTRSRSVPVDAAPALPDLSLEREFDSIELARYAGFWNDWHLVTVRFRKDNGEQRFIYANAIAWKAMQRGDSVYPDGAMFGKMAFQSEDDPAFPNSVQPQSFTRLQLMRKDTRAYPASNGWGYAIVVGGHRPPYDSATSVVTACHACHMAVPERDFVFSSSLFIASQQPRRPTSIALETRFEPRPIASLISAQRHALSVLPPQSIARDSTNVRSLSMTLFSGSINESVGVLSRLALRDSATYALWDDTGGGSLVVRPIAPTARCRARTVFAMRNGAHTPGASAVDAPPRPHLRAEQTAFRLGATCDGTVQW